MMQNLIKEQTVLDFIKYSRAVSKEKFIQKYPYALLVDIGANLLNEQNISTEEDLGRKLITRAPVGTAISQKDIDAQMESKVIQLVKREGSFIGKMMSKKISVGREDNNDIVLAYPSISKTHAYFAKVENGYILWDLDSANGTFVNGQRLLSGEQKHLSSADEILFANQCAFTFYLPEGFYNFLGYFITVNF